MTLFSDTKSGFALEALKESKFVRAGHTTKILWSACIDSFTSLNGQKTFGQKLKERENEKP
jgi:hypothetical protein